MNNDSKVMLFTGMTTRKTEIRTDMQYIYQAAAEISIEIFFASNFKASDILK